MQKLKINFFLNYYISPGKIFEESLGNGNNTKSALEKVVYKFPYSSHPITSPPHYPIISLFKAGFGITLLQKQL
jgi:hypothetical protein